MAENPLVAGWQRIPDGSELEISAKCTNTQASVTGSFEILASDGTFIEKLLNTATGKSAKFKLQSPLMYSADLLLHFDTNATVAVMARVVKPDGTVHASVYNNEITRPARADVFISFFLFTLK